MNVRPMGDGALLVETRNSAEAQSLRRVLLMEAPAGVMQLVPGYRSLLLVADPLVIDLDSFAERLPELLRTPTPARAARSHKVLVSYGGEDLDATAKSLDMTVEEVIRRHSGAVYTVAFLGFAPGFPYLTGLDPKLVMPRLATPRTHTPEGAVAVAGEFTGIYPGSTPGGWHVLGRTNLKLFDAAREPPALFAPGDQVRFKALP